MREIILRVCLWATVPLAGFYGLLFWKLEIWPKMRRKRRKRRKKKAGAYAAGQKRQNIYRQSTVDKSEQKQIEIKVRKL